MIHNALSAFAAWLTSTILMAVAALLVEAGHYEGAVVMAILSVAQAIVFVGWMLIPLRPRAD